MNSIITFLLIYGSRAAAQFVKSCNDKKKKDMSLHGNSKFMMDCSIISR